MNSVLHPLAPAGDISARTAATRGALMDAAEELLARQGVSGTSARDIVRVAGVNLGAINYHFGTKDRLILEVFARRIRPLNAARLALLDALEMAAGAKPLAVESIVEAMVRPVVAARETESNEAAVLRLFCRAVQEANPEVKAFIEREFAVVVKRFDAAILRAIPGLPPPELFWRVKFLAGALHYGLEAWSRFGEMAHPNPEVQPAPLDREAFIRRFVAFVAAGLAAPQTKA